jgi:DNA-binding NtrC family response regulator
MPEESTGTRIFVVDDEPLISKTLGMVLRMHGFETHSFESPMEALRSSKETPPDLLISDVVMPDLTGIELATELLALYPACKVLLISGNPATIELLKTAREQGRDFDVLAKPVHPVMLLNLIETTYMA